MTNEEKAAIRKHLSEPTKVKGGKFTSGFMVALRDARQTTGRNPDTENVEDKHKLGNWLGAMGYMALLDQIGKCFKPKDVEETKYKNSFKKALKYFNKSYTLIEDDIEVLWALRNAFMHDFSLTNVDPKGKKHYIFSLSTDKPLNTIVEHAKSPWNGTYENMKPENQTFINLQNFNIMVELIYNELIDLYNDDKLEIILDGGVEELQKRYSFYIS